MKELVFSAALLMCGAVQAAETDGGKPAGKRPPAAVQLKEVAEEVRKSPEDFALREKAVKLAAAMKPAPAVPPEARRHFVKGVTFQKEAASISDYQLAAASYKEALLLAPWWPDAIFNLAAAQESAGLFDDSARTFGLYLLSNPKDAEETRDRIYALEAKKEKAAKDAGDLERRESEERLRRLDGGRWRSPDSPPGSCIAIYIEVHGNQASFVHVQEDMSARCGDYGRVVAWKTALRYPEFTAETYYGSSTFRVTEDGSEITEIEAYYKQESRTQPLNRVYQRVR